ncbi:MAG: NB-ARC domain-containing protein, partial [Leptolyngbyaceae cyanobacterium]
MTAADPNVQVEVNAANDAQVTAVGVVKAEKAIFNQTLTLADGQTCVLSYSDVLPELRYFQGRTQQLATLTAALHDSGVSVIGVRGDGGIGKSTLAAKAFSDCQGFQSRCWLDVRTQPAITDLATRALLELGVPITEVGAIEAKDRPQRLLRHLQGGRYLLAIDNLESLLTAEGQWQGGYGDFLERFRDSSGQSVLLLASREYPQRYYSWLRSHWLQLEQGLDPAAGAALLRDLEIQGSDDALAAASKEVRGHPLALTLMAGWIREAAGSSGQRCVERLEEVDDYFQVTGRHRGESDHSLQSVLAWSLERLSLEQQHLLTQVSVLRSWFTAEVAEAMITETLDVPPALRDLERRSLVQEAPGPQYRLQPRIRDLVQQRADDVSAAHERAIQYFWQQRTVEFVPNAPKETAAEYFEVFYHQVQLQRWPAALQTLFACDAFLRLAGGYQDLVDRYEVLHQQWPLPLKQQSTYGAVCNNLGNAYDSLGEYQRAITFHEQSLEIARAIGDRHGAARSLIALSQLHHACGRPREGF